MKNVAFYERVSTTEQADHGYSLNDQRERLEQFCKIKGHTVHLRIREDYSAKTFDRPEFKKLLAYIKKNRGAINLLLVIKWDRFSRNATDALGMIRTLNKLGVEVNATEQPIDFSIPENKLLLSLYVTSPEVENDRRSLNVIKGMRRANLEGRYLGPAPKGYDNKRDQADKPILVKNELSKYISESFELIGSKLYSQREVLRQLNAKGFSCSKTQFSKILQNCLYSGKVMVRATVDEPVQFVTGIHEPIISDELFIKVQDILVGRREKRKSTKRKQTDGSLPLRGFLVCPCCSNKMSGSKSKGRNQHYHYYHCNPCNRRYRADDVNEQFEGMISKIQIEPGFADVYLNAIKNLLNDGGKERTVQIQKCENEINKLEERTINLTDKFADGDIDSKAFNEAKNRYNSAINKLKAERANLDFVKTEFDDYLSWGFCFLVNVKKFYSMAPIEVKQIIIGSIYPENIEIDDGILRTARVNELVSLIATTDEGYKRRPKKYNFNFWDVSRMVPETGLEPVQSQ